MNNYKIVFNKHCPINNLVIEYKLKIKTKNVILIEDLLGFVEQLPSEFHETFADKLFAKFSGKQTLIANHHGVTISTKRATW